jgi:hypothetical protein
MIKKSGQRGTREIVNDFENAGEMELSCVTPRSLKHKL